MASVWVEFLIAQMPDTVEVVWSGGENTVTVRGDGLGGRNTEFALAAALELDAETTTSRSCPSLRRPMGRMPPQAALERLPVGKTILRARAAGIDPEAALATNDSATFFQKTGGLVVTGPSGTNVNDLYLGLRKRPA